MCQGWKVCQGGRRGGLWGGGVRPAGGRRDRWCWHCGGGGVRTRHHQDSHSRPVPGHLQQHTVPSICPPTKGTGCCEHQEMLHCWVWACSCREGGLHRLSTVPQMGENILFFTHMRSKSQSMYSPGSSVRLAVHSLKTKMLNLSWTLLSLTALNVAWWFRFQNALRLHQLIMFVHVYVPSNPTDSDTLNFYKVICIFVFFKSDLWISGMCERPCEPHMVCPAHPAQQNSLWWFSSQHMYPPKWK